MKTLLDLLNEIEEKQMTSIDEAETNMVDEIGKFFVVTSPFKDDNKEDILFESDVFSFANQVRGGLKFEEVIGLYKNKSDANRIATEALKERDSQLDELKSSMEEFRNHKTETEDKKSKAKELIQKLKK